MAVRKKLLVEGTDDENVLKHICGTRGVGRLDKVKNLGGFYKLRASIPAELRESDLEAVGVVVDADTDMNSRWQSIRDQIISVGYQSVPIQPVVDGTILDPPEGTLLPKVGIWIMPNNRTDGILENFLRFLVRPPNDLFDHVEASVAAIPQEHRRFKDLDEIKAIIHTWLAWQEDPGQPYGIAITAGFLDPNIAEVDPLVSWLKRLFFDS
ncbi:MAG: hypothetical protein F4Y39_19250 [Gemmatimonadetes bacterium]|nr:hypothetical protein [Gemmatimonadota bacterium]MYK50493.1 hypothetical protein [Gemmatimonadota bacterium]